MNCRDCKHWKTDKPEYGLGECSQLLYGELSPEYNIEAGWNGGYIESIVTEGKFGCVMFEDRKCRCGGEFFNNTIKSIDGTTFCTNCNKQRT